MKVVLANSVGIGPGGERYVHFPSRWSAVESPSWYDRRRGKMTFYPFMLAYASALLKRDTSFDVKFLDGNLNDWDHQTYLEKIVAEKPDRLVMESSTLSFPLDIKLAREVKDKTGCGVIFAGQHTSAFPEDVLKAGADFALIGEYEETLLELLTSDRPEDVEGAHPNGHRKLLDPNTLPWPEDEDVRRIDYIEPVVSEYREIEMFSSRGCPLACNFCVAANVYYDGAGSWRPRNVDDVTNEIACMKKKYPEMEGVFFDDEIHNGRKDFVEELCRSIIGKGLGDLKYNAMCGYWNLDRDLLSLMKEAGYYKLRVGIETADHTAAMSIGKTHSIKRLYRALTAAKEVGIKMYGTFTYGAMGSTKKSDRATTKLIGDLLKEKLLFDLQISICTPQPGTPFYKKAEADGLLSTSDWRNFDGGKNVIVGYPDYSASEIEETVSEARRTASLYGGGARFGDADFSVFTEYLKERNGMVLVIGSGPKWQTDAILKEIDSSGGMGCSLLVREGLRESYPGRDVFTFGDGALSEKSLGSDAMAMIERQNPGLVIVQVNHNCADLADYSEIFRLAEMLGGETVAVDINGKPLFDLSPTTQQAK
jgi:radical SAM superfamily enzyme YgiQ (UPF0313 family)